MVVVWSTAASDSMSGPPPRAGVSQRSAGFHDMNGVLARVLIDLTASMRFAGDLNVDLNEITTNLVPYPRMHYLMSSIRSVKCRPLPVSRSFRGSRLSVRLSCLVCGAQPSGHRQVGGARQQRLAAPQDGLYGGLRTQEPAHAGGPTLRYTLATRHGSPNVAPPLCNR
jgi:hypothetical protein